MVRDLQVSLEPPALQALLEPLASLVAQVGVRALLQIKEKLSFFKFFLSLHIEHCCLADSVRVMCSGTSGATGDRGSTGASGATGASGKCQLSLSSTVYSSAHMIFL